MQLSVERGRPSSGRRSYEQFAAERRAAEVGALRAAARDLRIVGQMDSTRTAEWLDHRAERIENPEPPKPMTPLQLAAFIIGTILLIALAVVMALTIDFSQLHPV